MALYTPNEVKVGDAPGLIVSQLKKYPGNMHAAVRLRSINLGISLRECVLSVSA
jgi:hypothetical protein